MVKSKKNSDDKINPALKDNPILIQNDECEAAWWECQKLGVFAVWNGSNDELFFLSNWLEENCRGQVSISFFSEKVLYLNCIDESVKNEFVNVSECFFNGHIVKFIKWCPNFRLEDLDFNCPIWFNIQSLPPELNQIEILKSIGADIGDFIGIDASFQYDNNVKLLINTKFKQSLHFNKKVVTNKASYNLNLHSFEGDISEIIKIEDKNGMGYNNLPLTSDFRSWFSTIYNLRKKMGMRSSDMNSFLQIQSKEGSQVEMLNNESVIQKEDKVISAPSVKVKSIIVNNHRKPSELIQEEKAVRKHKSKKNKRTSKRNSRYRMDSDEEENKTITETKADICQN